MNLLEIFLRSPLNPFFTQTSWPWGGTVVGDAALAPYDDDEWSDIWRKLWNRDRTVEGVLPDYLNELIITNPSGNTIRMATGGAVVDGKFYDNDANVDIVVGSDGTYRAVLQKDWITQEVRFAIESGASPTQIDGTTWEIKLANVVRSGGVFTITDQRNYVHSNIEVSTAMLADLAVTTIKLGNDSVDDTKAGNRVAQFYRRQGGSPTDWSEGGVNNYTPTSIRVQFGVINVTIGIGSVSASQSVTFPVAFSDVPIVITGQSGLTGSSGSQISITGAHQATASGFVAWASRGTPEDTSDSDLIEVTWMAIGPE